MKRRAVMAIFGTGACDFARMIARGDFTLRKGWTGLRGAGKYLQALARGDIAPDEVIETRLGICSECDAATPVPERPELRTGYCGVPFRAKRGCALDRRTCGCLLVGHAAVASSKCPRLKWTAVVSVTIEGGRPAGA